VEPYERSKLADALQEEAFGCGDFVIIEGDKMSKKFYILLEGEAIATKKGIDAVLKHYKTPGEYFGERALLFNEPRAASIQVIVRFPLCSLISIVRDAAGGVN